jgi:flagellar basal body-associated protein FliL
MRPGDEKLEDFGADKFARQLKADSPATRISAGVLVVAIILGLACGGGTVWFAMQGAHAANAIKTEAEDPPPPKYIIHLEGFTVNLADSEESHFLRITVELGVDRIPSLNKKEKDSEGFPKARIRDAILSVLTICKADVLLTTAGKLQLKKDLIETLNRTIPDLAVREAYFTEFLVQR